MNAHYFTASKALSKGETVFVGRNGDDAQLLATINTTLPPAYFPVGTVFSANGNGSCPYFMVVQNGYSPAQHGVHSVEGMWVEMLCDLQQDSCVVTAHKEELSLAWVTLSDKGARKERVDGSGPLVEKLVREKYSLAYSRGYIIADEELQLRQLLCDLALRQKFDLIVTTGGTGVAPRDVTPEATVKVIDRRLRGMEQAMMAASLQKTPNAVISRAIAGTLGTSLIVNMPGSTKAVAENLEAVLPAFGHTIAKLQGDPADCGN
ncbi:MogA/MoaB family molybdenum cofactor biosynthesis protein [Halodesulfovibrio sp.]|jgi:molybdenum cofactor synthesis domain-containing protein|uniref:MogA/MoaB family molybdenum cofactor biosynthesis protein n=1 Tax=Halodesulfovibrio sp. TaxID=1912772 RepID=UPI0025E9F83C|nr:MogA/MoaB family molybdenum cofactor biosynthesis protein [Halodesulfovibrio sp.]MCT4534340.1 MogA/MoaB family molybdenum cofactor biosynthesis protein [Halodesulfovibrio sp.]